MLVHVSACYFQENAPIETFTISLESKSHRVSNTMVLITCTEVRGKSKSEFNNMVLITCTEVRGKSKSEFNNMVLNTCTEVRGKVRASSTISY